MFSTNIQDDWVFVEHADLLPFLSADTWECALSTDHFTPELRHPSSILTDAICRELSPYLPARAQASPWCRIYSTQQDGYSLRNMYHKVRDIESPALLLVKDVRGHIFGAITSSVPRVHQSFCGNGESCVFSFSPTLKVWQWCNENNYNIMKGSTDWMAIGCGSGAFALWLDSDLNRGRTETCGTYRNQPLCDCGDFLVETIEVWTFGV
ncbi:putative TLD domain-containing protein 2 [Hypsibius exemplaris]|uniref:Oxidation resistance protein 1 n=1 Tax=Hypsibius exemplaris TaxID=2072580 RepID=A0A1W0XAQ3_HYPEX|nr:putative TLD domain-containing protein 2 [Hypsibius exemplaris]